MVCKVLGCVSMCVLVSVTIAFKILVLALQLLCLCVAQLSGLMLVCAGCIWVRGGILSKVCIVPGWLRVLVIAVCAVPR
jgi:hypothetical protein